ncbi:MAG TPA: YceI family protein, partial [Myxococcaceae bacterium]|nr:YceI family protein [Myxococcaceae bacterium]
MRVRFTPAALTAFAVSSLASASNWQIDPAHSAAQFSVRHMMVSNVRGEFGKMSGWVNLDDKDVGRSTAEATIDTTSINTREPKRDTHLKSADFFEVEKYPTMTFKSTSFKRVA